MKTGWQRKTLGEVCEIIKGRKPTLKKIPSKNDLPYLVAKVLRGSKEPEFASIKDPSAVIVSEDETIIICDGSNSGEIFSGYHGILSSTMGKISKKEDVDDRYLRTFLYATFNFFNTGKTGAAIPHLDKDAMYALPFPYPSIPEQKRIVRILDKAFNGIAIAEGNAKKNLQNARALFESQLQCIFTQRGLEWVDRTLAEVSVVFGRGKSRHRPRNEPKLYGGKYPFIQTGDVRNAVDVIRSYSQTYNDEGLAQSKLWPAGTVCITIAANIAETAITGFECCFPDSMIGVVVDENITTNTFLLFLLQSFKTHLKAQGKGSAQDNINMGTFDVQLFPFPPLKVQNTITKQLQKLRTETQLLETIYKQKCDVFDELKKSLLHQAFTGNL